MKTIAFFNNKGGVGKTSLVYHLAWMLSNMGVGVIAIDLDPQANLTGMFKSDDELERLWQDEGGSTVYTAVQPLLKGVADIKPMDVFLNDRIHLLPGDIRLSGFEDELSQQWPKCMSSDERAFRVETAFARLIHSAEEQSDADYALIDIGPNLGAINRAALIACDYIITPLAPDLFSLQGLKNLGPTLKKWRSEWQGLKAKAGEAGITNEFFLPDGGMWPLGYVMMRHSIRLDRPVKAFDRWMRLMPAAFRELVVAPGKKGVRDVADDKYCLAQLKDYRSLMPLAQQARRPMFNLKSGDGAIGAQLNAVKECYNDFKELAERIVEAIPADGN